MVKFRMESGCMAMQLVLCLLLGLRLVSASLLQQSKAGSLFQLPFSHRTPQPASREWRLAEQPSAKSKHRGHRSAKKDSAAGAGAVKRSLRGENVVCEKGNQKRDVDLAAACGSNVAGDFGHANAVKESMVNSPESAPPVNDYDVGSSNTQSGDSGWGDGYSRAWSNRKAPHPAPYSGSDASSSPSSSPDAAAPPIASLPDTDPGTPTDTTPNTNTNISPDPNQDPTPSSNSTAPAPSTQPSSVPAPHTRQRTVAIAAGVTVPVVAMGLVALLLLHKQRRRRKEMQQARLLGGGDEEAHTPATLLGTPQLLVKEMPPGLEGTPLAQHEAEYTSQSGVGVDVLDSQASVKVEGQEDAALARPEEASETSHSSVSAGALSPSTSSSSARLGRSPSGPMHKSAGSGVTRNRSLKRKPVPALIETDEPEKPTTQPPGTAPAPASEQPSTSS